MKAARWVSFSHAAGTFGNACGHGSGSSGGSISGGGSGGSGGSSGTVDVRAVVAMLVPPHGGFVASPNVCCSSARWKVLSLVLVVCLGRGGAGVVAQMYKVAGVVGAIAQAID